MCMQDEEWEKRVNDWHANDKIESKGGTGKRGAGPETKSEVTSDATNEDGTEGRAGDVDELKGEGAGLQEEGDLKSLSGAGEAEEGTGEVVGGMDDVE